MMLWKSDKECVVCDARAVKIVLINAGCVFGSTVIGSAGKRELVSENMEEVSEGESMGDEGMRERCGGGGK